MLAGCLLLWLAQVAAAPPTPTSAATPEAIELRVEPVEAESEAGAPIALRVIAINASDIETLCPYRTNRSLASAQLECVLRQGQSVVARRCIGGNGAPRIGSPMAPGVAVKAEFLIMAGACEGRAFRPLTPGEYELVVGVPWLGRILHAKPVTLHIVAPTAGAAAADADCALVDYVEQFPRQSQPGSAAAVLDAAPNSVLGVHLRRLALLRHWGKLRYSPTTAPSEAFMQRRDELRRALAAEVEGPDFFKLKSLAGDLCCALIELYATEADAVLSKADDVKRNAMSAEVRDAWRAAMRRASGLVERLAQKCPDSSFNEDAQQVLWRCVEAGKNTLALHPDSPNAGEIRAMVTELERILREAAGGDPALGRPAGLGHGDAHALPKHARLDLHALRTELLPGEPLFMRIRVRFAQPVPEPAVSEPQTAERIGRLLHQRFFAELLRGDEMAGTLPLISTDLRPVDRQREEFVADAWTPMLLRSAASSGGRFVTTPGRYRLHVRNADLSDPATLELVLGAPEGQAVAAWEHWSRIPLEDWPRVWEHQAGEASLATLHVLAREYADTPYGRYAAALTALCDAQALTDRGAQADSAAQERVLGELAGAATRLETRHPLRKEVVVRQIGLLWGLRQFDAATQLLETLRAEFAGDPRDDAIELVARELQAFKALPAAQSQPTPRP